MISTFVNFDLNCALCMCIGIIMDCPYMDLEFVMSSYYMHIFFYNRWIRSAHFIFIMSYIYMLEIYNLFAVAHLRTAIYMRHIGWKYRFLNWCCVIPLKSSSWIVVESLFCLWFAFFFIAFHIHIHFLGEFGALHNALYNRFKIEFKTNRRKVHTTQHTVR